MQNVLAQGCSQCKMLAEQGNGLDENAFAGNINGGILYLMLIPYLILLFLFRKPIFGFVKGLFKPKAN
jgi:ABC-type polysaccharide transport system permease subunit